MSDQERSGGPTAVSTGAQAPAPFANYQFEIYLAGLAGQTPAWPTNLALLEAAAARQMTPEALGYVAGGAETESTMRANREALDRWRILPRMLRNVAERDLSCTVLGTPLPAPVLLAPVGVLSIVHPEGELAVARAAAALGVPMVLSTAASNTLEDVAAAMGDTPRWYQLYWPRDRKVASSFLRRAKAAGYRVLVVTLDTRMLAWRPRDLDQAYLPFLKGIGLANYFADPAFQAGLARPVADDPAAAVQHWVEMFSDPSLTWDDLTFVREQWDGPVVLKGIQHVDDARLAVGAGMDGIIVSNHGGRQVDGAIGAIDVLPEIAEAVGDRLTVLFDSGIRGGADAFKALALGAKAVLLGRPYVYGLALGGEAGVRHVVSSLLAQLDLTFGLAGYTQPTQLTPAALRRV